MRLKCLSYLRKTIESFRQFLVSSEKYQSKCDLLTLRFGAIIATSISSSYIPGLATAQTPTGTLRGYNKVVFITSLKSAAGHDWPKIIEHPSQLAHDPNNSVGTRPQRIPSYELTGTKANKRSSQ